MPAQQPLLRAARLSALSTALLLGAPAGQAAEAGPLAGAAAASVAATGTDPASATPAGDESASMPESAPAAESTAGAPSAAPSAPPAPAESAADQQQRLSSCSIPEEAEFFGLEWTRRTSYRSVCLATHWLDSLFGDRPFDPVEGRINGHVALIAEKRQDEGWALTPKIRVRVKLPQATKRFDLFFDRDKESQTIAGEPAVLHPEAATAEETTSQLGIGYRFHEGVNELLNVRIGLRVRSWKPELFARSHYSTILADTGTGRWNFEQTLFWKKNEGFGETTSLEHQRHLGGPYVFRWTNGGTLSELADGLRWHSTMTLFHALSDHQAISWSYGANGETGQIEPVANHGPRVSFRQRLNQRWLILELYTGIDQVKSELVSPRQAQAYFGARIEAHFSPQ